MPTPVEIKNAAFRQYLVEAPKHQSLVATSVDYGRMASFSLFEEAEIQKMSTAFCREAFDKGFSWNNKATEASFLSCTDDAEKFYYLPCVTCPAATWGEKLWKVVEQEDAVSVLAEEWFKQGELPNFTTLPTETMFNTATREWVIFPKIRSRLVGVDAAKLASILSLLGHRPSTKKVAAK